MRRVLCFCEKWESGGIEAFLTSVYERMDLSDLRIDIVTCQYAPGIYDERLARVGLSVRVLSGSVRKLGRNLRLYRELLAKERYDVAHLNLYEGAGLLFAAEARRAGVPKIIVHSHNTDLHPGMLRSLKLAVHRSFVRRYAGQSDVRWAPSEVAARFLFGDLPWTLLLNGIEPGRFAFDAEARTKERAALGVSEDQLLLGCVGRLCAQKNQAFLIDLLAEIPRAALLLVGKGEDESMLRVLVAERGVVDRVIFAGTISDVAPLYSAMDVLCVPSLFEGLGIVAIEGQAACLPVLCSPAVPPEAHVTELCEYHELGHNAWGERLAKMTADPGARERLSKDVRSRLALAGYDIQDTARKIWTSYCNDGGIGKEHGESRLDAIPGRTRMDSDDTGGCLADALVSIIVPVYQVEPYLADCLDSLLAQTYSNLEIILVDDGSTDGSGKLCDAYAERDGRVRVIHQKNAGLSAARNAGLVIARGDYYAFVDSDDVVSPFFVETLLGLDADIAQCGFSTEEEGLAPDDQCLPDSVERLSGRDACEALARDRTGSYTVVWNKLFRRRVFDDLRFPQGKQHEDEFVSWQAFWSASRVAITEAPLYFYRQRPESIMGRGVSEKSFDAIDALKERKEFYHLQGDKQLEDLTAATLCHRIQAIALDYRDADGKQRGLTAVLRLSFGEALRSPYVSLRSKLILAIRMFRLSLTQRLACDNRSNATNR